jgi:hypothetical protein
MNIIQHIPGTLIDKPGIYAMSLEEYHGQCCVGPSVSSSGLRKIFDPDSSPAHFWDESSLNPNRAPDKDSEFLILGRAAHHSILDEPDFDKLFVTRPETYVDDKGTEKPWSGNANKCKAWLARMADAGLTVLTTAQIDKVARMKAAIAAHPHALELLRGGVELSFIWQDEETGIWMKSRPDSVPAFSATGADLKCVSSVSDKFIANAMRDRGYVQQAAMVGEAFRVLLGIDLETFSFVFAEQDRPNCVRLESVHPEDYDRGWHANKAAARLIAKCLKENYWPGPENRDGDGNFFNLSTFARERMDRRIAQINEQVAA